MRSPALEPLVALVAALLPATPLAALTATPSTTEGPYYTMSSANNADKSHFTGEGIDNDLTRITSSSTQCNGTLFLLSGTLVNTAGTAIPGATIELWEADNGGIYWYTSSSSTTNAYASRDKNFQGYGTCVTDANGAWNFRTIKPGLYVGRIRHFHFKVRINGSEYLTSQFMLSEDSGSFSSDNVASPLVSAGTMSLVTLTPTSGVDSSGNTALIASKQIVISYTISGTAPTITTSPTSLTVSTGSAASFTVAASGTATLSYQWYKDGAAISGATAATYSISATTSASAGTYYAVVTNSAGSATSASATLTVTTTGSGTAPTISAGPTPAAIATGESVTFTATVAGTAPFTYQWLKDGVALSGATAASFTLAAATTSDAGAYALKVTNSVGSTTSDAAQLRVTTATANTTHRLLALSARTYMPSASNTLIAGFIVQGSGGQRVLVRAVGPALASYGVANAMSDPQLTIYDLSSTKVGTNDNWDSGLASTFTQLGAFALPTGSKDAALVAALPSGGGTAHVSGTSAGVVLVESYSADTTASDRLIALSARSYVGTGESILIAGFAIEGTGGKRILVRAVGPTLSNYGVTGVLADPLLRIYDGTSTLIAENDTWNSALAATFTSVGEFALTTGSKDAALIVTLPAGAAYTAQISGLSNTTGEALVEVYELP